MFCYDDVFDMKLCICPLAMVEKLNVL